MMQINRKLQIVQAQILEDVDRICAENGLTYYMIGGTLLGAVRHKGFIPWDDDIDLVMYREDYNKLIAIMQKEHSEKYFVQTFQTDPYYTRYVAKIRLNNTVMIEPYLTNAKSHAGVYIDIFPLDHVRKPDGLGLTIRGKIIRWLFAYKGVRCDATVCTSGFRYRLGRLLKWVTYLVPNRFVNWLFDYVCTKDNGKDCAYTTNFASHFKWKRQMFENEVYGQGCRLEFEGRMFNAPNGYIQILERLYGKNYMQLPPEEKRETHQIIKLDLGQYEPKDI